MTSPTFEKSRSLGTEVPGVDKNSRATIATPGNCVRFAFHQMKGHCDLSITFSVAFRSSSSRNSCWPALAARCCSEFSRWLVDVIIESSMP
jgi:hypothetical protein